MTLLLTGFEPFGHHARNISWEVAQLLQGEAVHGLRVATACLPVEYGTRIAHAPMWRHASHHVAALRWHRTHLEAVRERVPLLWQQYPDTALCVHCGVGLPGQLRLEARARNGPYTSPDNLHTAPLSQVRGAACALSAARRRMMRDAVERRSAAKAAPRSSSALWTFPR
jgi:hypothetical protein